MIKYVAAIGAATLAVALFVVIVSQPPPPNYQAQAVAAAATATAIAQRLADDQATAPARNLAASLWAVGLPLLVLVLAVAVLYMMADYYQQRRAPLVRADARGMYPVARHALARGDYDGLVAASAAGYHAATIEAARRAMVATVPTNYSPTTSYTVAAGKGGLVADVPALAALAAADVPTFASLLADGVIGAGKPLQLAYYEGKPINGGWKDLYSALLVGLSGSGKTTTLRYLACQSVLAGAKLVVIDPHINAGDESLAASIAPLAAAYLVQPPTTAQGMVDAIKLVHNILQARLAGDPDRTPVIALVDEYTSIIKRSGVGDALAALLEAILQEGRKVNVIALAACQNPKGSSTGGTDVRDSFTSTYVHKTRKGFARLVTDDAEDARQVIDLPTGSAMLRRTNGDSMIVNIPNTTAADVVAVGKLLALPAPATLDIGSRARASSPTAPDSSQWLDGGELVSELATQPLAQPLAQPATTPDPRAARVRAMFVAGSSQNDIVAAVWGGGKPITGKAKIDAHGELNAILRVLVQ